MLRALVVFTLIFVISCSSKDSEKPTLQSGPSPTPTNTGNTGGGSSPSCTLALPNNGAAVASGTSLALTVTASGGTAPYTTTGFTGSFPSAATLSRTYTNSGSTNLIVTESVAITDASGRSATCSTAVTVLPAVGTGTNLRCSVALNASVVRTGVVTEFVGTASGGTAPYNFVSFDLGGASITEAMTQISLTQARTKGTYATTGLKTATLTVRDADFNQFACYVSFTVLSPASVTITAAPSTTVETGRTVTLSATALGFTATPTLVYSTTEPGVTVTNSAGGAYVVSTDSAVHSFDVKVVATSANEQAESTIHLDFSAYVPLACTLTRTGNAKTGDELTFKITADNGETVQFTEFNKDSSGYITSSGTDTVKIKYYTPGSKTVSAKAVSTTSGKYCQNSALISQTFTVANSLSCVASVGTSWVPSWTYAVAQATIPSGTPFAPFYLVNVKASQLYNWAYFGNYSDLSAAMGYYAAGTYNLTLTVQDTYGNQATCTTVQNVY